jgi:carboxyl-terminal processing protease
LIRPLILSFIPLFFQYHSLTTLSPQKTGCFLEPFKAQHLSQDPSQHPSQRLVKSAFSHNFSPLFAVKETPTQLKSKQNMLIKKHRYLVASFAVLVLLQACKKNDLTSNLNPSPTPTPAPVTPSASALKDTTLLYSKDLYLWYTQIPASFNAQTYADPNAIMEAIRTYSTEPGFSAPVDKWSFAMKQTEWDNLSNGISGDFGMSVFFFKEGDLRVKSVERSSPAGRAGIRRGWRITKINGSTNIATTNADFISNAVWYSSNGSFSFQKPDGSAVDINLTAASYQEHPVYLDSVYSIASKKIGYFSFNSFLGDTAELYSEFARVFNHFASERVSDVIVDLRYNGGGYVSVQQTLADWLAPSSANGQLMMKEQFNDKYTEYNSTDYFRKLGSLNLTRIYFIVSRSTASASELLINNLKPFMDVQLVGPSKTYGKPVGFFPVPVGDWYIFPVSFRSTNKNGQGNYFDGMALNNQAADGLDKDWGDITETCLQNAIANITTGAYRVAATQGETVRMQSVNDVLDAPAFKGAVEVRKRK